MLAMTMIKMRIEVIWIFSNRKGNTNAFLIVCMELTFHSLKMIMFKKNTMTMFFNRKGKTNAFLMVSGNYKFSMI